MSHPLYTLAQQWRRDNALNPTFAQPRKDLHPKVVQAIHFVESEEHSQREERMEWARNKPASDADYPE